MEGVGLVNWKGDFSDKVSTKKLPCVIRVTNAEHRVSNVLENEKAPGRLRDQRLELGKIYE